MSRIKKALERAKAQGILPEQQQEKTRPVRDEKPRGQIRPPLYFRTKVIDVPEEIFIRNKIVSVREGHPISDQFKLLRTRIFNLTRETGRNTIQVSGFDVGEGKSTVSLNLAISMAKDTRQTTLLVDADFRRPSIHCLLGLSNDTPGLKQYFEGQVELEDIFLNPGIDKLTILPAGGRIVNSTEVVGSAKMEALVLELKQRYLDRYIIFDTPGINVCPDPLVLLEYIDGLILVARSDVTTTDSIKAAVNLVPNGKLLGTVLNDSRWQDSTTYHERY